MLKIQFPLKKERYVAKFQSFGVVTPRSVKNIVIKNNTLIVHNQVLPLQYL